MKRFIEQLVRESLLAEDEFMSNINMISDVVRKNANKIRQALLKMFPDAKSIIDYHYNDEDGMPFAEWRRQIYEIDRWKLIGPKEIASDKLIIQKEDLSDRQKKYDDYIKTKERGEHVNYFRNNPSDPRKIDYLKLPPITVMEKKNGYEIIDGLHRAFLAKMNNKPLNAYIWRSSNNKNKFSDYIKSMF